MDLTPSFIGEGGIVDYSISTTRCKTCGRTVVILKSKGHISLPDFTGWSKKMLLSYKMLSGLDMRINGNGYVTSQGLSKGTITGPDEPIVIQLTRTI